MTKPLLEIVEKAAEKAGGIVSLARELGIKHTAMYSWSQVPPKRVQTISRLTGVPPEEIRPDIFVKAEVTAA